MFRNYFTTAVRNFWRSKTFSIINVLGLSIGISAALVIFLIVYYEFSFDRFEKDQDRIYRVVIDARFNGTDGHTAAVPAPLSSAVQNEVTGIDETVPVLQFQGDATAKVTVTGNSGNQVVYKKQSNIVFTNQQYFQLLPYRWIVGSQQSSLREPFTVVLTESKAQQYFPDVATADIIGRPVTYNDITVTVSGIVKDLNEHTAFTAEEFISFPTISKTNLKAQFMMEVWNDWMAYSQLYIKISKGNTPERAEAQLKGLLKKYNKDIDKDANNTWTFHLQSLGDMHFNNIYQGVVGQRIAQKSTLYGLLAIAGFLLLLGCINFINLTTAQASRRAKEIGIRKTLGSSKKQLVLQFLSETLLVTIIATILSIVLTPLLLKMFQYFIPQGLHFELFNQPSLILFLLLLTIIVSFLSGLYPALILSGYKPVLVLKNQAFTGSAQTRNAWIRKTLTVFQFVIAQFFVIATLMVSKQINYSLNTDMGFNKDAIINFETPRDTVAAHGKELLNEIKSIPGIAVASTGFFAPADKGAAFTYLVYNNGKEELKPNTQIRWGDPNFIKVYQIKLVAGRNVQPSDTIREFLVNESYARAIGFQHPEDALNKYLQWNGKNVPVVGVMKDFHEQSVYSLISPIVFGGSNGSTFHIKLKPNNAGGTLWKNTIAGIQKAYKQMYPDEDFNFKFLDDTIASLYENEQKTGNLLQWATGLAIFISCLGLFGLVIYTTNIRTKEIGIRKILGASVANIISNLSKDFMQLVFIAFLIAAPIAWLVTYKWLQNFAYRTSMSWWIFAIGGFFMMLIALITLSMQTIKAAIANPVKSLRTE
jgi:putative ABC transport system permease protein